MGYLVAVPGAAAGMSDGIPAAQLAVVVAQVGLMHDCCAGVLTALLPRCWRECVNTITCNLRAATVFTHPRQQFGSNAISTPVPKPGTSKAEAASWAYKLLNVCWDHLRLNAYHQPEMSPVCIEQFVGHGAASPVLVLGGHNQLCFLALCKQIERVLDCPLVLFSSSPALLN